MFSSCFTIRENLEERSKYLLVNSFEEKYQGRNEIKNETGILLFVKG